MTTPDAWSTVPALVENLPRPNLLQAQLKQNIQEAYAALYLERGTVHLPEDTFDMQRRLARTEELFKGYVTAFNAARQTLAQLREEELIEARGEQDGIPLDGMTVPDMEGDIRITLDAPTVYDIDMDQLVAVLIANLIKAAPVAGDIDLIHYAVTETVAALREWGKVEPQVSKVKAWGATLARNGRDQDAATVRGAISKRNPYRGVKFERKAP